MNVVMGQAVKIFDSTLESITSSDTVEHAQETMKLAQGYITGLRLLGIFTDRQFNAMLTLLETAVEAVTERIEKTAPGVASTENGYIGDRPLKDNNECTISITAMSFGVKNGGMRNEAVETHS